MERLCKLFSQFIGKSLNSNKDEIEVIEYGLIAISQFILILGISLIISCIGGFFIESLIVFFSVVLLRQTIGGFHASNYYSCSIISVCCIILFGYLSKYVITVFVSYNIILIFTLMVYFLSVCIIYKLAPVDCPNKRIKGKDKIKRLRKRAFGLVLIFILVTIIFLWLQNRYGIKYLSYSVSLILSMLWQVTMLTYVGNFIIHNTDKILIKLTRIRKE